MVEKEIRIEIRHPEVIVLLIISASILFLELQTTFNSPIAFGDEAFHTRLAQWIAENVEHPIFYPFEGTDLKRGSYSRPPLWNLLEAGFLLVFGFNEFILRFLTPFIAILTGLVAFILIKRLFNEKIAFITSIITMTVPSFVTYSVLFYTDILFTFYATLFFFLFLRGVKEDDRKYLLLAGLFGGLLFLTKRPGMLIYLFIPLAFLYEVVREKNFYTIFKKYLPLVLILALIPSMHLARNFYYYGTPLCVQPFKIFDTSGCIIDDFEEKYHFAGRVEQTGTEQSVYRMGIINYLQFAYGNIWFVVFAFLAGLILIFLKKEKTIGFIFIYLFLFLLVALISTGRAEDTSRYTLGWVPVIALVASMWFEELYNFIKRYQKYLALIIFIVVIFFSFQSLTEKLDVMRRVKQFSPTFFEACDWAKENTPEDALLYTIWSHRAVYNCQRDAAGTVQVPDIALSRDLNYTLEVAKQHGITHLFIQKFSIDHRNRHLAENYDAAFVQFLENNPESFKKVYENGPPLQQCLQQGYCDGNIIYEISM